MTIPIQPKPLPIPAIIVCGTPTSPELTQASWFRAEDKQAAKAAAEALKFSVIDIQTEAEALTIGVHEGVLKGSGRMIVGSVSSEVYRRIENYVAGIAVVEAVPKPPNSEAGTGARVLAAYWNEKREFEGFWVATVKRIDKGEFTLEWFDAPEYPAFKSRPKNIAVPHPEFRVTGK